MLHKNNCFSFGWLTVIVILPCLVATAIPASAQDSEPNPWRQMARIVAADGAAGDFLGSGFALSGDTLVVGAQRVDVGMNADQGAAYVFVRSGIGWRQQDERLTSNDGKPGDFFSAVDISGDRIIAGAHNRDAHQGVAFIFERTGENWEEGPMLTAEEDAAAGDFFGIRVEIDGETAAVSAEGTDVGVMGDGTHVDQGAVYVFTREGDGSWSRQQRLSVGDAGDLFGRDIALSGDTLVVSSVSADIGGNVDEGTAFVFNRTGETWSQTAQLTAPDGAAGDAFGIDVALSADEQLIVVGAVGSSPSAYVFEREEGGGWSPGLKLPPPGWAGLSIDGDTIVAGDNNTDDRRGSAHIYVRGEAGGWTHKYQIVASDRMPHDLFGSGVLLSGDVLLVSSFFDDVETIDGMETKIDQGSFYFFSTSFFADGFESGNTLNWSATMPAE